MALQRQVTCVVAAVVISSLTVILSGCGGGDVPALPGTDPTVTPFDDYFGAGTCESKALITIADPDVPELFCDTKQIVAPCTFVHKSGLASKCVTPTPPDACHRYYKITYDDKCVALKDGLLADLAGGLDVKGLFDPINGVLKSCKDFVTKSEKQCFQPVKPTAGVFPSKVPDFRVESCDCPAEGTDPKTALFDTYFGEGTCDTTMTVVDPDVPKLFCDTVNLTAPCTFVHKSGEGSKCVTPTPPDKCHRYMMTTYDTSCTRLGDPLITALAGGLDTQGRFDPATGILKACKDSVLTTATKCFAPVKPTGDKFPSQVPDYRVEECECPEKELEVVA